MTRISLIAHSWATIVAGRFAARSADLVDRLVLFGPIAQRSGGAAADFPAWRLVSLQDQWQRFTSEVPAGEAPVLSRRHFAEWGESYLDSDPTSRTRTPASVKTPSGPMVRYWSRLGWRSRLPTGAGDGASCDHPWRMGQHVSRR